ncbi:cytochrome b-c1 complex subunit 8 [Xylaria sp. FL1042]|nr:cytochrome b-c1 complex subunit 8 [Xylaria sp. FL1042]
MRPTQILRSGGGDAPLGTLATGVILVSTSQYSFNPTSFLGINRWVGTIAGLLDDEELELGPEANMDMDMDVNGNESTPQRGQKQKGIITYTISGNRQNPLAGTAHDAIFNTWRRFSKQVLYVAPPFIAFYYAMSWATERYGLSTRDILDAIQYASRRKALAV